MPEPKEIDLFHDQKHQWHSKENVRQIGDATHVVLGGVTADNVDQPHYDRDPQENPTVSSVGATTMNPSPAHLLGPKIKRPAPARNAAAQYTQNNHSFRFVIGFWNISFANAASGRVLPPIPNWSAKMGITHYALASQAFKKKFGRGPAQTNDKQHPDVAWIDAWKAEYVANRCRDPEYAKNYGRRIAGRKRRAARSRLANMQRS